MSEGGSRQSSGGKGESQRERERERAFVKIRLKRRPVDWERFRAHRVRLDKFFSLSSAFVLRIRRGHNEHQRSRQRGRPLISENAIAGTRAHVGRDLFDRAPFPFNDEPSMPPHTLKHAMIHAVSISRLHDARVMRMQLGVGESTGKLTLMRVS